MNAWLLAGYVMLHFLWVGTLVAAAGAAVRLACRRTGANVRYAASLVMLAAVAATPVGIAAWLANDATFVASMSKPPALPVDMQIAGGDSEMTQGGVHRRSRWLAGKQASGPAFVELNDGVAGDASWSEFRRNSATVGESAGAADGSAAVTAQETMPPGLEEPGAQWMVATIAGWLPLVWLIGAPVTFLLLAVGLVGSGKLRRAGRVLVEGSAAEACARLRGVLRVSRRVALAAVEGLAQPVLVGILRPTILLPAAALNGWTTEELEMVLLHELAHVRRWDNLVNLVQRVVEAALFFHPCVWLASRQVRRDREECCDAMVVRHTQRPEAYAELLVRVAAGLRDFGPRGRAPQLAAFSAMAEHALTGRVRRILKLEDEPMWVSRRMLVMLVVLSLGMGRVVYGVAFAEPPVMVAGEGETDGAKPLAAGEKDPLYTIVYPIGDIESINAAAWLRLTAVGKNEVRWFEKNQSVVVSAPRAVHKQIAELLEQSRKKATQERVETPETNELRSQIDLCQTQLRQIDRDIADVEVMKQVEIQRAQSPSALESAVAMEMDKDPTIAMYKEQMFMLNQQIQTLMASVKNPANAQLRRLQSQYAQTEQTMNDYRVKAEGDARDRMAKIPNENLRAAMVEFGVRHESLMKKKAELAKLLREAEARLAALTGEEGKEAESPIAPPPLPENPDDGDVTPEALQAKIDQCQSQLRQAAHDLQELDLNWQIMLQDSHPGAADLETAVAEAMDKDPTIAMYKEQLFMLNQQIQSLMTSVKNPANPQLRRLQSQYAQTESAMNDYRVKAESEVYRKTPNKKMQAATAEYEKRRAELEKNRAELTQRLAALQGSLASMTAAEIANRAGGEEPELELRVNADGSATLDGAAVTIAEIGKLLAPRGESVRIRLSADASRPYQEIVGWMDAMHAVGVRKIAVDTRQRAASGANVPETAANDPNVASHPLTAGGDGVVRRPEVFDAYQAGLAAADAGNAIEALAQFAEAIRIDATFTEVYLAKGDVLKGMKEYGDAIAAYSHALDLNNSLAAAYRGRGECFMAMTPHDYDAALSDFDRVVDLDPRNAAALGTRMRVRELTAGNGAVGDPAAPQPDPPSTTRNDWDMLLGSAEGTAPEAGEQFIKHLEEAGFRARLVPVGQRLCIGIWGVPKNCMTVWETRMIDGRPGRTVRFVGRDGDYESPVINMGDWPPYLHPGSDPTGVATNFDVAVIQQPTVSGDRVTAYLQVSTRAAQPISPPISTLTSEGVLWEALGKARNFKRFEKIEPGHEIEWVRSQLHVKAVANSSTIELWMDADDEGAAVALMNAVIAEYKRLGAVGARDEGTTALRSAADGVEAGVGNPSPSPSLPGRGISAPYRLAAGDVLMVRAMGTFANQPLDGELVVEDEGTIALGPAYGRVEVAGLTVRETEAAVLTALKEVLSDVKVQVSLVKKAREGGGEAREGEGRSASLSPWYYSAHPTLPGSAEAAVPSDPVAITVGPQAAVADEFPEGVDETEAKRIVRELVKQGIAAEVRMAGDRPTLLVRSAIPNLGIEWVQSVNGGGTVWHCRVGTRAVAGGPRYTAPEAGGASPAGDAVYFVAPPETEGTSPSARSEEATPLYDGKTFDEWRARWRTELKVERRTEAIEALAAFARARYGREATEALLDVAGEYDFSVIDDSPEGQLKQRVVDLLTNYEPKPIPSSVWLPVLMERFKGDPDKWRPLMRVVLGRMGDADEVMRKLIRELMEDPQYDVATAAWRALVNSTGDAGHREERTRLLREGLASDNGEIRKLALSWTGFTDQENFPEPFEMLLADDGEIAIEARQQLAMTPEKSCGDVVEKLWAVVDDAETSTASHVAALRAIGALYEKRRHPFGIDKLDLAWRKDTGIRLMMHLQKGPKEELAATAGALYADWEFARGNFRAWLADGKIDKARLLELMELKDVLGKEHEAAMGPPSVTKGGGFF